MAPDLKEDDPEPVHFESLEEFSKEEAPPDPFPGIPETALEAPEEALPEPPLEPVLERVLEGLSEIDSIKKFSEELASTGPVESTAVPFTLKIDGKLAPEDAEKLLSTLAREEMGFREVDLEPQIADGKILIPRISEYAGVLLIQALRSVPAQITFGPSDITSDNPSSEFGSDGNLSQPVLQQSTTEAWNIPVTNADTLAQFSHLTVIDTVVASGLLTTRAVETASSEEYVVLLEALIRELRFKTHRRGGNAIFALKIQLTPLTLPTDYRVTVTGTVAIGT